MNYTRLFLVLLDPNAKDNGGLLEAQLGEANICQLQIGAWLVRSSKVTSSELSEALQIGEARQGIVVTAKYYAGYTNSRICETIDNWLNAGTDGG